MSFTALQSHNHIFGHSSSGLERRTSILFLLCLSQMYPSLLYIRSYCVSSCSVWRVRSCPKPKCGRFILFAMSHIETIHLTPVPIYEYVCDVNKYTPSIWRLRKIKWIEKCLFAWWSNVEGSVMMEKYRWIAVAVTLQRPSIFVSSLVRVCFHCV